MIPLIRDCQQGWGSGQRTHRASFPISSPRRPSPLLIHLFPQPLEHNSGPIQSSPHCCLKKPFSPACPLRAVLLEHVLLPRTAVQLSHTKIKESMNPPCLRSLVHRILKKEGTAEVILVQLLSFTNGTQKANMIYG